MLSCRPPAQGLCRRRCCLDRLTWEHLSQPRQGECRAPLPPHCPTQQPLLQQRRDPEVMQGVCGAAWTAMQEQLELFPECFLSDFGSLSYGCCLQHSYNGDLDLLPREQSRCWSSGTSPGGLKPLPVPPFLPPRCICATSVQPLALQACPRLETLTQRLLGSGSP